MILPPLAPDSKHRGFLLPQRDTEMNEITVQTQELIVFEGKSFETNPAVVFLAGKSANSRRVYQADLDTIANLLGAPDAFSCNWAAMRYQHTQAVRTMLQEMVSDRTMKPLAPATINRMLTCLRGVLKAAWRLGLVSAEDYHRAVDMDNVIGETLPTGRLVLPGELKAIMAECENDLSPAGVRDAAIIGLAYSGGLRRAELAGLDLAECEYCQETREWVLKVTGKRSKERLVFINNGAGDALSDWVSIRGDKPGPLFMAIKKSGKTRPGRLTTQAIYNLMEKRGRAAKVKRFSPHDLRRSYISDLLDEGVDISTVAKMAGHASVTTTTRYDRRDEKAMQAASKQLNVPYTRRC